MRYREPQVSNGMYSLCKRKIQESQCQHQHNELELQVCTVLCY